MMDQMDEFYQKIQTFLIKKDPEVGKLKFLSSRTTEESAKLIEEIITAMGSIFEACNIPIKEGISTCNMKCIEALKYFILNTNFNAQEFLQDDLLHGHLVDMCPPLSPYLFIELIWFLEYDQVLAESILYLPLDLCIEILEILRRCVHMLDFPRGFNFLVTLAKNSYIKVLTVRDAGTQSQDFEVNLESLIINYQEILTLLTDKKCTRLLEVSEIKRSERYGYILREILQLTTNCLEFSQREFRVESEREKLYKITFGRGTLQRCDAETAMRHIKSLNLELFNVLLKKVKKINCNIYLDWASLEADGNPCASLQQMIGIECFDLIQFIKMNNIEAQDHLVECLQQLSVKPESLNYCTTMNLMELCEGVEKGNHYCLKQLLIQRNNWDHSVFDAIRKKVDLFDRDDFVNLLEYLTELMVKDGYEEHKQMVYNIVTRVFFFQKLKDLYEITLEYILKHNAENILESIHTEKMFVAFILKNPDFKTPNKLKIVLFFLLKNSQKFLMILIRICIGSEEYSNIMINPDDLILLSPIMTMLNETGKLVLSCLLKISLDKDEFTPIKFSNFIDSMLKHNIFTPDELIHTVYIPSIETPYLPVSTVRSTLNNIRQILVTLNNVNLELLLKSLAKKMSQLRNDRTISKYLKNEILTVTIRIVQTVLRTRDNWFEDADNRDWIIELEALLQPVDKFYFSKLFNSSEYFDITEIIDDYLRQTNTIIQKAIPAIEAASIYKLNLEKEIMKHLILTCTESEYVRIASEITVIHWGYFKYADEVEGFDNIMQITIEACEYCLRASETKPDYFGCLIKSLSKFVKGLIHLELEIDKQLLFSSFLNNFRKLNVSVKGTEYEHFYNETVMRMNNRPSNESAIESLAEVISFVSSFGDKCLKPLIGKKCESKGVLKEEICQNFISMCLIASFDNQSCIIRRVKDLFLSTQ
ncbi:uncharacterized protein LOC107037447 [Diachasma alloeum]|uniref:uncharacterized protein LOC107037447 n=1 Tax=Diachasma alloeum TaxID=454923 RepID=UPI0007384A94|nr:uncharacterized protein LOC107037447 [Diachasma alloeum]